MSAVKRTPSPALSAAGVFCSGGPADERERWLDMTTRQRGIVDELAARLGGLLKDLERLIQPEAQKPARVPVPVPVRPLPERRPRSNDPYGR